MCASAFWDTAPTNYNNTKHPTLFRKVGTGGLEDPGGEEQISSIGLDWSEQCVGKAAHCGAGIIEIFSGRAALNGKGSCGADAVLMCVSSCLCVPLCAQVTDKLERCGWWHLHEWVNLLLSPPHTTAAIVLLGSGGLTAGALLPPKNTHAHTHTYRHVPWWGGRKSWKWGCASCDGEH